MKNFGSVYSVDTGTSLLINMPHEPLFLIQNIASFTFTFEIACILCLLFT